VPCNSISSSPSIQYSTVHCLFIFLELTNHINICPTREFSQTFQQKSSHISESQICSSVEKCGCMLQVGQCVDTLCKYLENIIQNPAEEKFQKIRMSNRVYQDRVAPLEGTQDFLVAAGFKVVKLPFQDGEEDFWVFSEENLDNKETLQVSIPILFLEPLRS